MEQQFDVLIVGAGHAGAQAAIALRQQQFAGTIAIVGEEPDIPYERPPLSKEYLARDKPFDRILIRPATFWRECGIEMLTGRRVVSVNAERHIVSTQDGLTIGYGKLVWATGGHPRRLTCVGHDVAGVHSVRNRADVDRMIAELSSTTRVVVIGGGYIGLEAAAVLTKLGKQVTILEAQDRVLARVAGVALSHFFLAEHLTHGVDIRLGTTVERIEAVEGRAVGVRLETGEIIPAEMVIVGIGIIPAVEPLLTAGALGVNGVAVDEHAMTTLNDVFAIGDCALHANSFAENLPIRLESVQNANDMATALAKTLTGEPSSYNAVPWFWSNQYDLKLQTVGLSTGHDEEVVRGDPASRSFTIVYLKRGRIVALDCVNSTKDYVQGRHLIVEGVHATAEAIVSVQSLKELRSSTLL